VNTPPPVNSVMPSLSTTPRVGGRVLCQAGAWKNATGFTYRWFSNTKQVSGSNRSWLLGPRDYGLRLRCEVTAVGPGGTSARSTTSSTIGAGKLALSSRPTTKGTPRVGKTLYTRAGTWSPGPTSYAYQWFRGGKAIKGAIRYKYKVTSRDRGKYLTVRVTAHKYGYARTASLSRAVKIRSGTR
jgi:hypothetical protein